MATFYSADAKASWRGDYTNVRSALHGAPSWVTVTMSVTSGQAVANNIFNLIKLDANTVVLDGYLKTTGIDGHATATATMDLGYLSDADGDGDTDVIDFFVDGHSLGNAGAAAITNFDGNDLGTSGPFYPVDTLTSDDSLNTGYFISAKLLGAVATAAAGTITVGLLLAPKDGHSSASL